MSIWREGREGGGREGGGGRGGRGGREGGEGGEEGEGEEGDGVITYNVHVYALTATRIHVYMYCIQGMASVLRE